MVHFRRLQEDDDLHRIVDLSRAFFDKYETHHKELLHVDTLTDQQIIDYLPRLRDTGGHAVFVAVRDGQTIGYITIRDQPQPDCWKVRQIGHISGLMVRKADRREGIGAGLLEEAKSYLREHRVKYYTVYTAVAKSDGIAFYENRGLAPLHTHLVGTV